MAGLGGEARRKLTPSLRKELERMGGATPSSGAGGKKASKVRARTGRSGVEGGKAWLVLRPRLETKH